MPGDSIGIDTWIADAMAELAAFQNPDGGWAYRSGEASATEPTSLAALALSWKNPSADRLPAAETWLTSQQRADGFFPAAVGHDQPSWATPLAALALNRRGLTAAIQAAADALLTVPVYTFDPAPVREFYDYGTDIQGWPWTYGDFSFVEPTCLAMILLKQVGRASAARVVEAASFLRDRALSAGGWNYGEPRVLGAEMFPLVAPTALALLALADEQDAATEAGLSWLLGQRDGISSLFSVGWASVALNVLGRLDDAWRLSVTSLWYAAPPDRRGPMETSLCLLGLIGGEGHPMEVF